MNKKQTAFTKPSRGKSMEPSLIVTLIQATKKGALQDCVHASMASCKGQNFNLSNAKVRNSGKGSKRVAFTLAEVLITLAIIGVVAAMTIPTLIAKINTIVTENQAKVFNAKLIKGLNLTKTAGDLNDTYNSTYEFLTDGLGKNLKMAKVCDASHIRDCVPYDKIKYEKSDGTEGSVNVKDLNAQKLQLDIAFKDVAAFVLADGTPAIVSYNLKCIDDPDKADTSINACLAGIYDLNGTRKPNKFGTKVEDDKTVFVGDIQSFNGARVGGASCLSIGGQKACVVKTAKYPSNIWQDYFTELPTYTDSEGNEQPDYWTVAQKYCEIEGGHLPSAAELATIARVLYDDPSISDAINNRKDGVTVRNKTTVYSALGIEGTSSWFALWGNTPDGTKKACRRDFMQSYTSYTCHIRNTDNRRAICLE